MKDWSAWIGREDIRHDHVDAGAVKRWLATLDRSAPADDSVPQAYHWCLCLPDAPTAILGADGHPVREDSDDSFLPPIPSRAACGPQARSNSSIPCAPARG